MSKLINFFFSFDKLLKEGLVRAAFWLGLLIIALKFTSEFLGGIGLDWLAALFKLVLFFARFLFYVVALRITAELAIAIFRINDNISPDGGKSETADIDPVAEAKKAAEIAARRAQEATKSAVDKTNAATKSASERSKSAADDVRSTLQTSKPQIKAVAKTKAAPKKAAPKKEATKTATPKPTAAKTRMKPGPKPKAKTKTKAAAKPTAKKTMAKRRPGYKLDGTPRKKPGPKPKA